MILSCSGYRPNKLPDAKTGYKIPNPTYIHVCQQIEKILLELKPEKCLSGMALGSDQYFASVCIKLKIPFVGCIPFQGQEDFWPEESKKTYKLLLKKASEVIIVSPGEYIPTKLQIRNEYLVDNCDKLIAVINPLETSGGTFNCLQYAKSVNKEIIYIDPRLPNEKINQ